MTEESQTSAAVSSHRFPILFALLCLLWGSAWLPGRWLADVPHYEVLALRCLTAALMVGLLSLLLAFRKYFRAASLNSSKIDANPRPSRLLEKGRLAMAREGLLLAVLFVVLPSLLAAYAEPYLSPGLSATLFASTPLWAAFLGRGAFSIRDLAAGSESPLRQAPRSHASPGQAPRSAFTALLIGLGGLGFALSATFLFSIEQVLASVVVLAAAASVGYGWLRAKAALAGHPILPLVSVQLFAAAALMSMLSFAFERSQRADWSAPSIAAIALQGCLADGLGVALSYAILRQWPAHLVATTSVLVPVIAVMESAAFLREFPPWRVALGIIIALGAMLYVLRTSKKDEEVISIRVLKP